MSSDDLVKDATKGVIQVFKDRWSIDQEENWDEFASETFADVKAVIEKLLQVASDG